VHIFHNVIGVVYIKSWVI